MNLTFDKEKHEFRVDGVIIPSVTQILKDLGFIDDRFFNEYGCQRGQYVHEAIDLLNKNDLADDYNDPVVMPYVEQYKKFLKVTGYQVLKSEQKVHNPHYRYAGILDSIGMIKNNLILVEVKTGSKVKWHRAQTAAYLACLKTMNLKVPTERYCLYLTDTNWMFELHEKFTDNGAWMNIVGSYWFKNEREKR